MKTTNTERSTSPKMKPARAHRSARVLRNLFVGFVLQVTIASTHTANAHSTISTTGASAGKKSTTTSASTNPASTDGLVALMEANYLDSESSAGSQAGDAFGHDVQTIDEISDNSLTSFRKGVAKSRKQAENQMKALDWWAHFAKKNAKPRAQEGSKARSKPASTPPSVYREQPLSQNPILTIRNQLLAIRNKHHLLVTRSVNQLMQLDQKLVDSYKLCLKKKMPLYAGMLYRTRDYVVRMANEVKLERQVLAAITKQAQRILKQKVENRTLVKEYNRLASTGTDLSTSEPVRTSFQPEAYGHDHATADNGNSKSKRSADAVPALTTTLTRAVSSSAGGALPATTSHRAISKGDYARWISDEASGQQFALPATSDQQTPASFLKSSFSSSDKIAGYNTARNARERVRTAKKSLENGNNSLPSRRHSSSVESNEADLEDAARNGQRELERFEPELANSLDDYSPRASSFSSIASTTTATSTTSAAPVRQQSYTVSINEVNLKRELLKTQALIDRINTSSVELMGVVEDIIYLFKLTSGDYNSRKWLAMSGKTSKYDKIHGSTILLDMVDSGLDPKRAKKIAKSPFKVLLERYNKLTSQPSANLVAAGTGTTPVVGASSVRSTTSHSDMNGAGDNSVEVDANNMPEMRPLFDSRSLSVEMELTDLDLGFDAPAVIETQ